MEVELSLEEQAVRDVLAKQFGDRYINEPMVVLGGYYLYLDTWGHGEDLRDYFYGDNGPERRKKYLERHTEDLEEFARLLKRYDIPQQKIRGIGLMGSVPFITLSDGQIEDKHGNMQCPNVKILKFENFYKNGEENQYFNAEGDAEHFGIQVVNDGLVSRVIDSKSDTPVSKETSIDSILIDKVDLRLERWVRNYYRDKRPWFNSLEKLGLFLQTQPEEKFDMNEVIKLTLSELEMIKLNPLPDLDKPDRHYHSPDTELLNYALLELQVFIDLMETYKNNETVLREMLEVPGRQTWKYLFDQLANGQRIHVLMPDSRGVYPALFLLATWMAQYGSSSQEMASQDLKDYWSNIKGVSFGDFEKLPIGTYNLIVARGTEWDEESNKIDTLLVSKLKERLGQKLHLIDIFEQKVR